MIVTVQKKAESFGLESEVAAERLQRGLKEDAKRDTGGTCSRERKRLHEVTFATYIHKEVLLFMIPDLSVESCLPGFCV
jgi:hypothetical protein